MSCYIQNVYLLQILCCYHLVWGSEGLAHTLWHYTHSDTRAGITLRGTRWARGYSGTGGAVAAAAASTSVAALRWNVNRGTASALTTPPTSLYSERHPEESQFLLIFLFKIEDKSIVVEDALIAPQFKQMFTFCSVIRKWMSEFR